MQIRFGCGHHTALTETRATPLPECPICGDRRVSRVDVRPPRFVGHCTGPHAELKPLEAFSAPLTKKERT